MRLKMVFQLKKPEIPIEYRRAFLSLLKKSFQEASPEIYDQFYGNGTPMKPFTFGVYLPQPKFTEDKILLASNEITLNFSTHKKELGIYFYNSLVKNRSEPFPLAGGNHILIKRVMRQQELTLRSNEEVFKTLTPFLVRRHDRETNRDEYLTPDQNDFVPRVENIVGLMLKKLKGIDTKVEFMPVKLKPPIPIKHFGGFMKGNTGIFKLSGSPEALDFIYHAGFCSRRSEGFGLIESLG
ncbi:MAG: CRISPR-associated endoribonuclease Cas6 [bacterium]|nr:CRISPR-associated endoribonuclease Cas6 [bacterium]